MNNITWKIERINDLGNDKIQVLWLCDASKDGIHKSVAGYSTLESIASVVSDKTEKEILNILFETAISKASHELDACELLEKELLAPSPNKININWLVTKEEYEKAQKEGRITRY
jgi:hypothetical protein